MRSVCHQLYRKDDANESDYSDKLIKTATSSSKTPTLDTVAEDSYSLSSSSQSSSQSTHSGATNSSQGILRPPRRANGSYNPHGVNTDFSIVAPPKRVHFTNISKIGQEKNALEIVTKSQNTCAGSVSSDDSSTSFEHLMRYIRCGAACDAGDKSSYELIDGEVAI